MRTFEASKAEALESWLPGVRCVRLTPHWDQRGAFTEVHRVEWGCGCDPLQWNLDHSRAGTLRGMHAHRERFDYLTPVWGSVILGLHDARRDSPSRGRSASIRLCHADGVGLVLPPGVAHGFYFPQDSALLIGFSRPWSPTDDVRCHHLAPELGLAWPTPVERISAADAAAQGYQAFLAQLHGAG